MRGLIIALCLCSTPALAGEIAPLDVRPITQDSTDVFDILSRLPEAKRALDAGEAARAYALYRTVYLHDPTQPQARLGLADSAIAMGRLNEADKLLDRLDHVSASKALLSALRPDADNPDAILRIALGTHSDDPRLWTALGLIQLRQTEFAQARQSFAMADMAGARPGLSQNNIGQSFLAQGKLDTAFRHFEQAVAANPNDTKFDNNRRLILLLRGEYSQALQSVGQDRSLGLIKNAAVIALKRGDRRLAHLLIEKALEMNPRHDPKLASLQKIISE